tara:strand:+ start:16 stop:1689 length:1674 start_codon:yes stop_codon:yes gene_type:complete
MNDKSFDFPFYRWEKELADKPFLRQPFGNVWETYTWGEVGLTARKLASGLKSLGLKEKSHIGLVSKNCREWIIADLAITIAGFISVPFFPNLKSDEIKHLLDFGDIKALFVGKLEGNWDEMKKGIDTENLPIITFPHYEGNSEINEGYKWIEFINKFDPQKENYYPLNKDIWTIIFTSGTTGDSKGAVITYESLSNTSEVHEGHNPLGIDMNGKNRMISYLPLNHIFERICIEWTCLMYGGNISFVESIDTFGKNLQDVEPTTFAGVPRIYKKFQEKILEKIPQKWLYLLLKIPVLSKVLKTKFKNTLGFSKVRTIASGAAAMPQSLLDWFKSIDIYIHNGYGMTENCCVCTNLDPYQELGKGSVGKISSKSVKLKITDNGEICMTGPFLLDHYYKNEKMTNETLVNGWLHTGDKGYIDKNGFLHITGRVKDIFKTSKGKYIEPSVLESNFDSVSFFHQMCIVGVGLDQPLLLAVPSPEVQKNKDFVLVKLSEILEKVNKDLDGYKKIKKIIFVKDEWTPENGLVTPTLKIKRSKIDEKFSLKYNNWEKSDESVVWE